MNNTICHISTVHPLFDSRIFYRECTVLRIAGYDVYLVVRHNRDEVVKGIQVIGLPKPKNRFQLLDFEL